MKKPCTWIALAILGAMAAVPLPASAQASRTGATFNIGGSTSPVILPDVAYDSIHDRYLVVQGNGFIEGQLLDSAGTRIAAFPMGGGNSQTPRVAFSPDVNGGAGGYLVTWHQGVGQIAQVWGLIVSADGVALTGNIVIALEAGPPGTGSNWTMGAAVAYSTVSREFLVTWMGGYFTTQDIRYTRLNTAGAVLQFPVAITGGPDWERDPSVAYNPQQDEFYITYAGYLDAGHFGYVNGQRIKAGTGSLIGGPATFIQSAATLIPHVEYNAGTQQYLVAWYNNSGAGAAFYGVSVRGSDGVVVGGVRLISSYYFAYDALDIAYNAVSGDFLLVTHGAGAQDYEDASVSIKADGTPYDNGFILTQSGKVNGNYNPRIVASAAQGRYLAVASTNFATIHGQFATSSASNCVSNCPPPPPPAAAAERPAHVARRAEPGLGLGPVCRCRVGCRPQRRRRHRRGHRARVGAVSSNRRMDLAWRRRHGRVSSRRRGGLRFLAVQRRRLRHAGHAAGRAPTTSTCSPTAWSPARSTTSKPNASRSSLRHRTRGCSSTFRFLSSSRLEARCSRSAAGHSTCLPHGARASKRSTSGPTPPPAPLRSSWVRRRSAACGATSQVYLGNSLPVLGILYRALCRRATTTL